jgi:hypothetical protein
MKPTDRNPDIFEDEEHLPAGMQVVEGKYLMLTARQLKIPFGVAVKRGISGTGWKNTITVGLVIRDEHLAEFNEALEIRHTKEAGRKLIKNDRD